MVIKEAQRSFTYLNIYDFNVDAIVVNRVIPESVKDDYFKGGRTYRRSTRRKLSRASHRYLYTMHQCLRMKLSG